MKIMKNFIVVLTFLLCIDVFADEHQKAVIIFDASGSMWGQIDGRPKISIARDVLKNVVRKWNSNVELGLTVYGHHRKGDCNDIENIVPVGQVDKKRIINTVMSIQPKGRTPISRSLKKAADELKYTEEKATIILISDGKETCDSDPCGTAKELENEGIDFVTHVIGFNVDKKTDKQLECIAHATGGEYFSAKNASALNKAMDTIVKKVEKPKPVIKNTVLVPVVRYNMSPSGLNVSGVMIEITQDGQTIYSGKEEAPEINTKVAKIHLKANYARASIKQTIEKNFNLQLKEKNIVSLLIKSGKVAIDTAEEQGGSKVKSSVHIYPVMDGMPNMSDEFAWCVPTKSKACERVLPVGEFLIKASYNGMETQKQFSLDDKEQKTIHLYFKQTGKVKVSASEKEGGKWIDASCQIFNEDKSDSWGISPRKKESSASVEQLPVGKYTLNCSYNAFKRKGIPVEVKAGETSKVHVVFGRFVIKSKCLKSSERVLYEIYASNGQLIYDKRAACSQSLKLSLPDETYTVEATVSDGKEEAKFTIGSGHPDELILDLSNLNHQEEIKADKQ